MSVISEERFYCSCSEEYSHPPDSLHRIVEEPSDSRPLVIMMSTNFFSEDTHYIYNALAVVLSAHD